MLMLNWVYMFGAMFLFGVVNFNRKIITKGIPTREALFWEGIGMLPLSAFVFLTMQVPLTLEFVGVCVVSAVLAAAATGFFYLAIGKGYVSAVTTVVNLNTQVGAVLAFVVFAEAFSFRLLAGIVLAAVVVLIMGYDKKLKPGKWMLFALLSLGAFAFKGLVDKYLTISYAPLLAVGTVMFITVLTFMFAFVFSEKKSTLERKVKLVGNGVLVSFAVFSLFMAFSLVPLSIAFPVIGMNTLVTVLLASYFLKERLDKRAWLAVALAVLSVWLLAG
jgi:drug/metabolite transporter (DMT)-like permease